MNKKILILSTNPRKGGNSDTQANEFFLGDKETGNQVEKVCRSDKTIGFCKGCLACNKTHRCVIHHDADTLAQKMLTIDVLVFATSVYYYEMCGQMKTMLDRANPLFGPDYRFSEIHMLSTATEDEDDVLERAENGLQGWIECFPKARLAGTAFAGGVDAVGEIKRHPALSNYEMEKAVSARKE